MPTLAMSAYGIQLRLSDGTLPGAVMSGATNTTPITITSTPHGVVDVTRVVVSGVTGNTAANGEWLAEVVSPTQLLLRGSAGNGTYGAGTGIVQIKGIYAKIAEITNLEDMGATSTLVDVSAHDGVGWVSRKPTLLDNNAIRLSLNLVPTHATHNPTTGLEYLLKNKIKRDFLLVFPNTAKTAWGLTGYVTSHRVQGPVAGILTAQTMITFSDPPMFG